MRKWSALGGSVAMTWSVSVLAAPEVSSQHGVHLTWTAPIACPRASEVTARMAQLIVRPSDPRPLIAEATVAEEPSGYRLDLRIWQAQQPTVRTMRAATCGELADAVALLLALLSAPALPEPPPERTEASQRAPVRTPEAPRTKPLRSEPAPSPWSWGAFGRAALTSGALPGWAPGFALGALADLERLRLNLGAVWFPIAKRVVTDDSAQLEKGGKFSLVAANAQFCYRVVAARPDLGLCGMAELGALRGSGFGTAQDQSRAELWAALGPSSAASMPLSDAVALSLEADLLFALNRPHFELDNVGPVHRPSAAALRVSLGMVVHFP